MHKDVDVKDNLTQTVWVKVVLASVCVKGNSLVI